MNSVSKVGVLALAAAFAFGGAASAKTKLTYDQAFAKCKAQISKNVPMSDTTSSAARYSAGASCMKKYGYRL